MANKLTGRQALPYIREQSHVFPEEIDPQCSLFWVYFDEWKEQGWDIEKINQDFMAFLEEHAKSFRA